MLADSIHSIKRESSPPAAITPAATAAVPAPAPAFAHATVPSVVQPALYVPASHGVQHNPEQGNALATTFGLGPEFAGQSMSRLSE